MSNPPTINTPPQGRTAAVVGDIYRFPAAGRDLLREVGFTQVDVLHKTVCFAASGAVKG